MKGAVILTRRVHLYIITGERGRQVQPGLARRDAAAGYARRAVPLTAPSAPRRRRLRPLPPPPPSPHALATFRHSGSPLSCRPPPGSPTPPAERSPDARRSPPLMHEGALRDRPWPCSDRVASTRAPPPPRRRSRARPRGCGPSVSPLRWLAPPSARRGSSEANITRPETRSRAPSPPCHNHTPPRGGCSPELQELH